MQLFSIQLRLRARLLHPSRGGGGALRRTKSQVFRGGIDTHTRQSFQAAPAIFLIVKRNLGGDDEVGLCSGEHSDTKTSIMINYTRVAIGAENRPNTVTITKKILQNVERISFGCTLR